MRIGFGSLSSTGLWTLLFPPALFTSASPKRGHLSTGAGHRHAPTQHVVYIENTPIFVQIAEGLGIRSILHSRLQVHLRQAGFVRIAERQMTKASSILRGRELKNSRSPRQFARFLDLAEEEGELNHDTDTRTAELVDTKPEAANKELT